MGRELLGVDAESSGPWMTIRIAVIGRLSRRDARHMYGELGHDVLGVDVDGAGSRSCKLAGAVLRAGTEALRRSIAAGRLGFTSSFEEAAGLPTHFIAVGTPPARRIRSRHTIYRRRDRDVGAAVDRTNGDLRQIHSAGGHRKASPGSCARTGSCRRRGRGVGTPNSCAGLRGARHAASGSTSCSASTAATAGRRVAHHLRSTHRREHPIHRYWPAAVSPGVGECVSSDEDLIHQRHGEVCGPRAPT